MSSLGAVPFGALLDRVASKTPAPGGGAVAAASGAMSAALARMVVAYSLGKKSLAEHHAALDAAERALATTQGLLLELADEDAAAYAAMNELKKLPESDPRRAGLPGAVRRAVDIPAATIAACVNLLRLYGELAGTTNRHLASDLAIAAILAEASARASLWNVRVNAAALTHAAERDRAISEAQTAVENAAAIRLGVESRCH